LVRLHRLAAHARQQRGLLAQIDRTPLTPTQRVALKVIVDEGPRIGALAERIGMTEATATRTVDSLVAAGLAERTPHPQDRRGVVVTATRAGRSVLAERRRRLVRIFERGLEGMPEAEREQLVELLEQLNELLEPAENTVRVWLAPI